MTPYDPVTSPHLPEVFAERTAPPPAARVTERIHGNLTRRSEVEHLVRRRAWRADRIQTGRQWLGNMAGCAVTSVSVCHCGHYDTYHRGHYMILITVVIMWCICDMSLLTFWHMSLWSSYDKCHRGHFMILVTVVIMWYRCDMSLLTFWLMSLWSLYDKCHRAHYDACHRGHLWYTLTWSLYNTCHCSHYDICHYGHYMKHVTVAILKHVIWPLYDTWHLSLRNMSLWSLYDSCHCSHDTCHYGHYTTHVCL